MVLGRCSNNFKNVIFKVILLVNTLGTSHETAEKWMPQDTLSDTSILVQGMVWCHQATSHYQKKKVVYRRWTCLSVTLLGTPLRYLKQCRPRSIYARGITRPQWINNSILIFQIEMSWPHGSELSIDSAVVYESRTGTSSNASWPWSYSTVNLTTVEYVTLTLNLTATDAIPLHSMVYQQIEVEWQSDQNPG